MKRKTRIRRFGEVILLDFPGVKQTKRRPAVVVSSQLYHQKRPDVIVGLVTSQIASASSQTDCLLKDWRQASLWKPSAFRAFLITIPQAAITRRVGNLSQRDWRAVV